MIDVPLPFVKPLLMMKQYELTSNIDISYLFDIEDMCIRIHARMEHSILKYHFRHIAIRIIIRYDNLKSVKRHDVRNSSKERFPYLNTPSW